MKNKKSILIYTSLFQGIINNTQKTV